MPTRRQFLAQSGACVAALAAGRGLADDRDALPDGSAAKGMITPAAQQAIDQGLAYLARSQARDGSFGTGQYQGNVAVTSLAALAMMAGGHQPGRGTYGEVVTRALRNVLDQEDVSIPGYLKSRQGNSHGPMYGHGFGTLFLAEVHGMVHDRDLRERLRGTLKRAVKLIVEKQNAEGGWRYQPERRDADISATICQIMALRAARNAGFFVPKTTVDRCIEYVKRCQERDGGFRYMAQGGPPAFARTAAGVVALYSAGVYKGPEVEGGLKYLMNYKPQANFFRRDMHSLHYFYGHYYAAQAMWTAGGHYWAEWYPAIRDELVNHPDRQRNSGCWFDQRICHDYGTAMACIILQIPNNYLPILQK
jgi:prenyltransferase beta subunit